MEKPPVLKPPKSVRLANTLNLILPGAGQFYLGQRLVGGLLASAFLACLFSMVAVFLGSYIKYFDLAMSSKILEGDRLEHMESVFHPSWLFVFLCLGLLIYVTSAILMFIHRRRNWS